MLNDHFTTEQLTAYLEDGHPVQVLSVSRLDFNVYRVEFANKETSVVRIFASEDAERQITEVTRLLEYLHSHGFPAERLSSAIGSPVQKLDGNVNGGCLLLTHYVNGTHPERNRVTFYRLGILLAKLNSLPVPDGTPKGGSWHHLTPQGGFKEECDKAIQMLESKHDRVNDASQNKDVIRLCDELRRLREEFCVAEASLPCALVHPDPVPPNVIVHEGTDIDSDRGGDWTVIDWAGTGVGPRILPLAFLLAVAALRGKVILVHVVMKAYSTKIQLNEAELAVLPWASYSRFFTIGCWEVGVGRKKAADVVKELQAWQDLGGKVANTVKKIVTSANNE